MSFANMQLKNYLLYALGEMVLVVIGILFALQIDNWNTERHEQDKLENYLHTIARNMRDDLIKVDMARAKRESTVFSANRAEQFVLGSKDFDVADVFFASYALLRAQEPLYFTANTSGQEALKNSGVLGRLQGSDLEALLYDYYDTATRIESMERDTNDNNRQIWSQFLVDWPEELQRFELFNPSAVSVEQFQALQPTYQQLFNSPLTRQLIESAYHSGHLLVEYAKLAKLGSSFIHTIDTGSMELDDTSRRLLASVYDPNSGLGYGDLIVDGQIAVHSYYFAVASAMGGRVFNLHSLQQSDDSLHIDYPGGADWAVFWLAMDGISESRPSLDFSSFDRLLLELKGDRGGEKLLVHIKDKDDPDDGSQTSIALRLTDQWQTYEVDLASLVTADLGNLHVVLGFTFGQDAQSFSMRTVRYLDESK
jgi:hypothetical protein